MLSRTVRQRYGALIVLMCDESENERSNFGSLDIDPEEELQPTSLVVDIG